MAWGIGMVHIALFLLAPLIGIIYSVLEHFGVWDRISGRKSALTGLNRLRNGSGYPTSWIYDDAADREIFESLLRRVRKRTENKRLKEVLNTGSKPSLITTGGAPLSIPQVPYFWPQEHRCLYTENHSVLFVFGVSRSEQGRQQGKADRACTLKDIDDWLRDEKENRKFWVGTLTVGTLSVVLIAARLAIL
jgi:hypothetical protein